MPGWLPAVVAVVLSALAVGAHIGRVESHLVEHFDRQVNHLKGVIAMSSQDAVNAVVAQIRKGTAEVVGRIADLQERVAAGQPVDLTELAAAAQALDDIVADAPVDPSVDPVDPVEPVDPVDPVDVPVDVPADDA